MLRRGREHTTGQTKEHKAGNQSPPNNTPKQRQKIKQNKATAEK
jgi:hypothetical protein